MKGMTDTAQLGIGATQRIETTRAETTEFIRPRPRPQRGHGGPSAEVVITCLAMAVLAGALTGVILGVPVISVPADPQYGTPEAQPRPAATAVTGSKPHPAVTVLIAGPTMTVTPRRTPSLPKSRGAATAPHPVTTAARPVAERTHPRPAVPSPSDSGPPSSPSDPVDPSNSAPLPIPPPTSPPRPSPTDGGEG